MENYKKFLLHITIINYIILKFLLLKSTGMNLNKFIEIISLNKNIASLPFMKKIVEYKGYGIEDARLLKYLASLTNTPQLKLLIDEYIVKRRVEELRIINMLERNRLIIHMLEEKINLYFIIFTAVLYPLPVVLIVISFFVGLSSIIFMPLPVALAYVAYRKMKKDIAYEHS